MEGDSTSRYVVFPYSMTRLQARWKLRFITAFKWVGFGMPGCGPEPLRQVPLQMRGRDINPHSIATAQFGCQAHTLHAVWVDASLVDTGCCNLGLGIQGLINFGSGLRPTGSRAYMTLMERALVAWYLSQNLPLKSCQVAFAARTMQPAAGATPCVLHSHELRQSAGSSARHILLHEVLHIQGLQDPCSMLGRGRTAGLAIS